MTHRRAISTEIGTALAVLAICLFTILAPLHEARASQPVFEELGYTTLQTSWALCGAPASSGHNDGLAVSKCPASGIGKPAAVVPGLHTVALDLRPNPRAVPPMPDFAPFAPAPIAPPSGPRAPPEQV